MATVAVRKPLPGAGAFSALRTRVSANAWTVIALVAMVGFSLYLRSQAMSGQFWMDEGLSVGIASHPLTDIPSVLRNDGSPPLYYMLLHVWMSVFGTTEADTHALSLLFALLTIPAGFWLGASLWGRRAGLIIAFICSMLPFLTSYGEETRMYSMMAFLSLVATGCYLHGFVYGRRKWLIGFALTQALMLYTHSWGIFFGVGTVAGLIPIYRGLEGEAKRRFRKDVLFTYGAAGLLWLPWFPTVVYQALHTAAPWDDSPRFGAPIQISRSFFGGDRSTVALGIITGIGLYGIWRTRESRRAATTLMIVAVVALATAWVLSQFSPAWVPRYFAAIIGPFLLLVGFGLSRAGRIAWVPLVLIFLFWFSPRPFTSVIKSDVKDISLDLQGVLHKGDLIVVGQPEQTPLVHYYLGDGYRYADILGLTKDPRYMDWRDAKDRIQKSRPAKIAPKLLESLKPGQQILFVRPITQGALNWSAPWTRYVRRRSAQWGEILADDPSLKQGITVPRFYRGATTVGNIGFLYMKK